MSNQKTISQMNDDLTKTIINLEKYLNFTFIILVKNSENVSSYKPNFITSSIMKLPISTIGKQKLMSAFFNTSMTLKRFFT